jgi:hypothetical protein
MYVNNLTEAVYRPEEHHLVEMRLQAEEPVAGQEKWWKIKLDR